MTISKKWIMAKTDTAVVASVRKLLSTIRYCHDRNFEKEQLNACSDLLSIDRAETTLFSLGWLMAMHEFASHERCNNIQQVLEKNVTNIEPYLTVEQILHLKFDHSKLPRDAHPVLFPLFGRMIEDIQTQGRDGENAIGTTVGLARNLLCITGLELLYSYAVGWQKRDAYQKLRQADEIRGRYFTMTNGLTTLDNGECYPILAIDQMSKSAQPYADAQEFRAEIRRYCQHNMPTLLKLTPEEALSLSRAEIIVRFMQFFERMLHEKPDPTGAYRLQFDIPYLQYEEIEEVTANFEVLLSSLPQTMPWAIDETCAIIALDVSNRYFADTPACVALEKK